MFSTNRMKMFTVSLGAALAVGSVAFAEVDIGALIHERQENMKAMGASATKLRVIIQSDAPDLAEAKVLATDIDARLQKIPDHFVKGSGPSSGYHTEAIEATFGQLSAFRFRAGKTMDASAELLVAIDSGDIARVRETENRMRGGCGGCHEMYRP
jgi:cytochrome c556